MELIKTEIKKFSDYLEYIDKDTKIELDYYINKLHGKKIAMINATSFGGGVAEMLYSMVPLLKDMGVNIDWWVMEGSDEFYSVTKSFHNALQGKKEELTDAAAQIYLKYNEKNAKKMEDWDYDFIVVHDPQPAALIDFVDLPNTKWIWRCHIDTSNPAKDYWSFLYEYIKRYDASIFTMDEFVKEKTQFNNLTFITPSIDPLSPKNTTLEPQRVKEIMGKFGLDTKRPLISQISRFDPWKDPLGVIDVYRMVKKEFPSVQLALIGAMASDDPEGWDYLFKTLRKAGEDYDIQVITNVSSIEVNAFQRASDVVLQKSLREGFGLTVSEALWKKTPVVGGNVGGIRLQIEDGVNGYLVDTVEDCAQKVLNILRNPTKSKKMGESGREKVRKNFLITTHILNYLKLFDKII